MKYAKKLLVCLLTSIMLFVCPVLAQAETNLSVWANLVNVQINGENKPVRNVLYDGTTYIALRDVSELLGCTVDWVSETRTAVINTQKGAESTKTFEPLPEATETVISVYADYVNVEIDGAKKDVRNFLSDGTTYIALRDVSELLGCTVDWVSETRTAVITTQSASVNPIVMTVNGIPVDKNTFLVAAAEVETAQQYLTDEDFINAAISQVVYKTVIRQQAESVMPNIAEDAKEAAQTELLRLFLNYGEDVTIQMLATYGFTTDSYLESAAFDHAANALFQYQIANGDNYKQVKDGAKTYYNNNKDAYKEHCVQVKHILIPFNGDVAPEETLKKAQNIANLATTSNFDTLLAENNNDPGQPETGYFVKKNSNFVPEFEATALSLKKGEISSPVRTAYGYHILYATEVYTHIPYEEFVNTYLDTNYNTLFLSEIEGWIREAEVVFVEENFLNILE